MVELKKDLPEIFEEFADQRRNSFLAIKKLKEQGVPVVGAFCTYLPKELPRAMGAAVVGLCSVSDETIRLPAAGSPGAAPTPRTDAGWRSRRSATWAAATG